MNCKHYERIIVCCCFLFLFVDIGLASTSFSVYQPYLVAIDGVGDVGGSLILSARTLTSLAVMFFVNAYLRRFDVRVGVFIACLLTSAGFFTYAFASSLPVFIMGAVLAGMGYGLGGMVGMTVLVSRWFKSRVGTVIGIASLGSGAASMIVPFVVLRIISAFSLSAAFLFEGVCAAAVAVIVLVFLRNHPGDLKLEPFSGGGQVEANRQSGAPVNARLPRHMRALLLVAMFIVGGFCMGGMSYISVNLTSLGYDHVFAGAMVALAGASLTASKLATGELVDHIGPRHGTACIFTVLLLGALLSCLTFLQSPVIAVAAVLCYSAGAAVGSVGISLWSLGLSDAEHKVKMVRNFQIAYAFGGFVFNTFPGALKEATGSYLALYALLLGCGIVALVIIMRAYSHYRPSMG